MSREQFEEELRSRMQEYNPAVDTQKLWSNIKKEKSKNYTGIVALLLLLIGTGIGAYFLTQNQNDVLVDVKTNSIIETIEQNNIEGLNSDISSKQVVITNQVVTSNDQEILKDVTAYQASNRNKKQIIKDVSETQIASANSKQKKSSIASNTFDESIQVSQSANVEHSNNLYDRNEVKGFKNIQAESAVNKSYKTISEKNSKQSDENSANGQFIDKNNHTSKLNETDAIASNISIDNQPSENYLAQNFFNRQNASNLAQLNNADFETYLLNERVGEAQITNWKKMDGVTKKRKPSDSKRQKYKSPKKTFAISVEALVGPMFPFRKLSEKNVGESDYLDQRAFTEKVLRGFKAELNTYGAFKKYGYFKVGVDYASFKESFIYNGETSTEYWDPDGISSVQINGDGDTTYVIDSVLVTQVVDRNINRVNTYNMLDLSVSMGFVLDKKKWSIFVDGGIAYNLMFKAKGQYLNEDLQVAYFSDEQVSGGLPLRKNLGPALVGNFGFAYKVNKNLDFKIKSGYKRYFNDFTSDENSLSQKYNFINLGLGIQYTFNNY